MAGTVVSTSIRSSSIAVRNAPTSNCGMITVVPPRYTSTSSWLLHPVTWNSGTDTSVRDSLPRSRRRIRRQVSQFDRKLACVVTAPLGKPVVPLV